MATPVGSTNRRRAGGRAGKQQRHEPVQAPAYLKREIPIYEMLNEEALQKIEHNADIILQEIGIDFKEDEEVLEIWRQAGCNVQGERVRFEKGMLRTIINATSPKQFTQHARNPDRSIEIGGDNMCFFPSYGSPFVHGSLIMVVAMPRTKILKTLSNCHTCLPGYTIPVAPSLSPWICQLINAISTWSITTLNTAISALWGL